MARRSIQQRKNNLAQWISDTMHHYDFDRGLELHNEEEVLGFKSWQEFVVFQNNYVRQLKAADLTFYETLISRFNNKALLMDKESMAPFEWEGFAFDINGNIVLFNPR